MTAHTPSLVRPPLLAGRWYYGWTLVLTLALTETISYGVLFYAVSVFIAPMEADLGWTRATISGGVSLSLIVAAVVGLGVGRWLDHHGARGVMTLGSLLAVVAVLAWSQVRDPQTYALIWLLMGLAKAMVFYDAAFWVLAQWFVRYRRRAITLLTFIAGFSFLIFSPLANALILRFGWREALVLLGLLLACTTLPLHALLLRRRPEDMGLRPDGDSQPNPLQASGAPPTDAPPSGSLEGLDFGVAVRQAAYWALTAAFACGGGGLYTMVLYIVPHLIDEGYDPSFAALAAGLVGLLSLPGRLIFTPLGERAPSRVAALLFISQGLGLLLLIFAQSKWGVLAFVALFSLGYGAVTPSRAALMAEYFGRRAYGAVNGFSTFLITLLSAASVTAAAAINDQTGSLHAALWIMAGLSGLAALLVGLARLLRPKPGP